MQTPKVVETHRLSPYAAILPKAGITMRGIVHSPSPPVHPLPAAKL